MFTYEYDLFYSTDVCKFHEFFFREIDLNLFFLEYNPLTGDTGSTTSSSGIANRYKGRGGGG